MSRSRRTPGGARRARLLTCVLALVGLLAGAAACVGPGQADAAGDHGHALRAEAPRGGVLDGVRADVARADALRAEPPRADAPQTGALTGSATQVGAWQADASRADASHVEAPQVDGPRVGARQPDAVNMHCSTSSAARRCAAP
ncbi:hypothetical protein, partial [Streptomyces synnematoformans]|uniref:hypothetical protein n=1 Tax=Streptomyces synnematoformans TaxID=415721 RepID=UPI003CD0849D